VSRRKNIKGNSRTRKGGGIPTLAKEISKI
jgi:hypothetical protein